MEEEELGPNGALMFCMEYLEDNLDDWLAEELEGYLEEDMVIFDCPGQLGYTRTTQRFERSRNR